METQSQWECCRCKEDAKELQKVIAKLQLKKSKGLSPFEMRFLEINSS